MSANVVKTCHHCGGNVVPVNHRCAAKARAIDKARENYLTRATHRARQVWDGILRVWVKL